MAKSSHQENKPTTPNTAGGKATRSVHSRRQLARKSGETLAQLQMTFGWQPHSARAANSAQRKAGYETERGDSANGSIHRVFKAGTLA